MTYRLIIKIWKFIQQERLERDLRDSHKFLISIKDIFISNHRSLMIYVTVYFHYLFCINLDANFFKLSNSEH